jgi:hypothetical protein
MQTKISMVKFNLDVVAAFIFGAAYMHRLMSITHKMNEKF